MSKIIFRTVMVVGDNADELIKKYDLDTKVEPYVKLKRSDASKAQNKHLCLIESILNSKDITLTDKQREAYKQLYLDIKVMDEAEYFEHMTEGCTYDEETGDAMSTINPNAYYQHAINPQKRLDATNEEHDFANPFILKPLEGEKEGEVISYVAQKTEIDWNRMHMYNTKIYERAWEMCVDGDNPKDCQEEIIKKNMQNRIDYFDKFDTKEDYVMHSCSFWCYGYLDKNGYKELDHTISDKEWVKTYYDSFVKPIKDNELISLYVVRAID
jgi:hypothetical protein